MKYEIPRCSDNNVTKDDAGIENKLVETSTAKQRMKSKSQRRNDAHFQSSNGDRGTLAGGNTKITRLRFPSEAGMSTRCSNVKEIPSSPYIRIIQPYPFEYTSNVKRRWIGRTVLDVYSTEFGSYPTSYYSLAIEQGRIKVSNRTVTSSYILQEKDILSHTVHRHEPAVAVSSMSPMNGGISTNDDNIISVVAETDEVIAVDKPSTMPVHPCGGYDQNTLMMIMESIRAEKTMIKVESDRAQDDSTHIFKDTNAKGKLHSIHRLDRLTSGLVILGKTSEAAKKWCTAIQERDCEKLYMARVRGKFLRSLESVPFIGHAYNKYESNNCSDVDGTGCNVIPLVDVINIPDHGEWMINNKSNQRQENTHQTLKKSNKSNNSIKDEVDESNTDESTGDKNHFRLQNALGYWITDHEDSIRSDVLLSSFSSIEHPIEEWLERLEQTSPPKSNQPNNKMDNMYALSGTAHTDAAPFLWFHFACPVRMASRKTGVCSAGNFDDLDESTYIKTVKPAQTSFAILNYNTTDDTTLLLVRPATGRSHQIRIHLQYLNHSIANDPNYGGRLWFGNPIGERACMEAHRMFDINLRNELNSHSADKSRVIMDKPATENEIEQIAKDAQQENESLDAFIQRTCIWCARMRGCCEEDRAHLEFLVRSPGLWLHALQYTVMGISFRTALPEWCK
jgi:23S rRNA-/tRNA-specific pseudouridylate synthase